MSKVSKVEYFFAFMHPLAWVLATLFAYQAGQHPGIVASLWVFTLFIGACTHLGLKVKEHGV